MSRSTLFILAVVFPLQVLGQMFPLSYHYVYNALSINHAFAGCHDALSTTISYRNQWLSLRILQKIICFLFIPRFIMTGLAWNL